jgi:tetratricopeptide (TPR) repeat protein
VILQRNGMLQAPEQEHLFNGMADQAVSITLESQQFQGSMQVFDAAGNEIGLSDEYWSPESPLVLVLPTTGSYEVVARSLYGNGGDYTVRVEAATPYVVALSQGRSLARQGNFAEAITAFERAIAMDSTEPRAHVELAEAVYAEATRLKPEDAAAVIHHYLHAAQLYEQQGEPDMARDLREQAGYLEQQASGSPQWP